MPHLAANLSTMFQEWPLADRCDAAAEAGFRLVEMQFPYMMPAEELARRSEAAGVEWVLLNADPGDWAAGDRGLAALPARAGDHRVALDRTADYVAALRPRLVHVMAGLAPQDTAHDARYRDGLCEAVARLGPLGAGVVIEPINPVDMPGYHLAGFERAATLIADLALPGLGLSFDIYHRQMMRGAVMAGLSALLPVIAHVQIAACPGRAEPMTGELDDVAVLAHLDAIGYGGVVGCEYWPRAGTLAGLGWRDRLADAASPASTRRRV